jgi:hypothetical protein
MADDKKADKKPAPKVDVFETLVFWFFIFTLISGLFSHFSITLNTDAGATVKGGITDFFRSLIIPFLKFFSYSLSLLSFFGIIWSITGLTRINTALNQLYNPPVSAAPGVPIEEKKNRRWERVQNHINSQNQNDWKFAILEADIILDDLLTAMGYKGETVADKLKSVEKSDFLSIDLAWEAHKVRNQIAHEGADYLITEREARRVVDLFKAVFEEFHFI